jgi:ParB/RepB/Spo0J family partition protein
MNYIWGSEELVVFDQFVPIEKIITGKNVRSDVGDISGLMESISQVGIINPLELSETPEGYILVSGERRLRAAQQLGFVMVPCRIYHSLTDSQIYEHMLAENFNRESMNAIDEGKAFRMMIERFGYTQEKLAGIVGHSQSYIAKHLSLLDLPSEIQDLVVTGVISPAHALSFLSLKDSFVYGAIADYFVKNVPKEIKPVAKFKDQIESFAYSAAKEAGIEPCYVSVYDIGSDAYRDKCSKCENYVGSYCYNKSCHAVLVDQYAKQKEQESSASDSVDSSKAIRKLIYDIEHERRVFISSVCNEIHDDISKVLDESGLSCQELFDRFSSSMIPPKDNFDSENFSLEDVLNYDVQDYFFEYFHEGSTLEDFIRAFCVAIIRERFDYCSDYEDADVVSIYSKILRDHGLSSSVFDKKKAKAFQSDLALFAKKIEDIEQHGPSGTVDYSDLPVPQEAS